MLAIRSLTLIILASATLALGACSSEDSAGSGADSSTSTDAGATDSEDTAEDSDAGESGTAGGNPGSATVTVDGETWEYPTYWCVAGYANTSSDVYSFSSTAFTTVDGDGVQLLVDVRDESGQDRLSGDGVVYEITVFDTDNPSEPSVDVSADGTEGVTVSEETVQVDGTFTDVEGQTYSIQVDATCGD